MVYNDPEAIGLMQQISTALSAAGLVHKPTSGAGIVLNIPGKPASGLVALTGIEIQIAESQLGAWSTVVRAMQAAFGEAGLSVKTLALTGGDTNPTAIHIMIGKKPV